MRQRPNTRRPGTIAPLLAILVVSLFSFVALAIDLGMLNIARTHAQNAADAAALAGARKLNNKPSAVENDKTDAATAAGDAVTANKYFTNAFFDDSTAKNKITVTPGLYDYDSTNGRFVFKSTKGTGDTGKSWTAMRVTIYQSQDAYFSRILGVTSLDTAVIATAVHRPRDIAFALDFTGSMANASNGNYNNASMSNDARYPQFGHYARFTSYSTDGNKSLTDATVSNRRNPLYVTVGISTTGNFYSPNNFTSTTDGGPAMVDDFYYDTSNGATPATTATPVVIGNLTKAFVRSPLPTADHYKDQTDNGAALYDGDRWPRKGGQVFTSTTTWDPTNANGAAITAAEFLGWVSNYTGGSSVSTTMPTAAPTTAVGSTWGAGSPTRAWVNFRDATWERYGYDLDVAHYITNRNNGLGSAQNNSKWDPRWDAGLTKDSHSTAAGIKSANPPTQSTYTPSYTDGKFKGYSMGPGYYGKTFFIWPPDPRWGNPTPGGAALGTGIDPASPATTGTFAGVKDTNGNFICDWRRRFFKTSGGSTFDPQSTTVNNSLLRSGTGMTLKSASGNYQVNYEAVLAWIKSGPSTLPTNLRAGRVVYYTSIPTTVTASGSDSSAVALDKVFWKNYIDYVLGTGSYTGAGYLAGTEGMGWPEGVTPVINSSSMTAYDIDASTSGGVAADRKPYMNYTDNPSRPRGHFWFGPLSMIHFISDQGGSTSYNFFPGTSHEAQCWQLKAAINSVLDDIRNNHPNDFVGLCFFSRPSTVFKTIRSPMSQDWTTAKNALFYPFHLVKNGTVNSSPTTEVRPYTSSFGANTTDGVAGNFPNGCGYTDPESGLAMAFNLLSPNTTTSVATHADFASNGSNRGRRGAAKTVILETDGVPNAHGSWSLQKFGYNSYYSSSSTSQNYDGSNHTNATTPAYNLIDQIVKQVASTNTSGTDSGYSLPSTPAKVYAIAFGDLFSETGTTTDDANAFLLECQKRGGTSASTDTALPSDQIITGTYSTRTENLRSVLERLMQSGVQVTLIE